MSTEEPTIPDEQMPDLHRDLDKLLNPAQPPTTFANADFAKSIEAKWGYTIPTLRRIYKDFKLRNGGRSLEHLAAEVMLSVVTIPRVNPQKANEVIIDHRLAKHRDWLVRHVYWCARNQRDLMIRNAKEGSVPTLYVEEEPK